MVFGYLVMTIGMSNTLPTEVKSVRVCDTTRLNLVPSISCDLAPCRCGVQHWCLAATFILKKKKIMTKVRLVPLNKN